MRTGDRPHAFRRRIVVEQYAAAAIDLEVDEAGSQQSPIRQALPRPIVWNLAPRRQSANATILDQHRDIAVPATAVEDPLAKNRMRTMLRNGILIRMHPGVRPTGAGLPSRPLQSNREPSMKG